MSVKVFQTNSNGKIEFTRAELEKLLNDTYKEGHRDGEAKANNSYWTWTTPTLTGTNSITYGGNSTIRTTTTTTPTPTSATITCTNTKVNTDAIAKLAVPKEEADAHKITANVSVNGAKAQTYDLSALAKEIDQILFGKPAVFACGAPEAPKNEHNATLAKELRNV